METWQAIAAAVTVAAGGIWGGFRWLLNWHHAEVRAEREAFAELAEKISAKFTEAIEELKAQNDRTIKIMTEQNNRLNEALEARRVEHLSDVKRHADELHSVAKRLVEARPSSRPPKT